MLELKLADQVADLPPQLSIDPLNTTTPNTLICTTSYWQIYWQIYPPPVDLSMDLWQFYCFELILADEVADLLADLPPQ